MTAVEARPEGGGDAAPGAVLQTHDVAVHYGGIKAVDCIDLTPGTGRILGILGPNGSGRAPRWPR